MKSSLLLQTGAPFDLLEGADLDISTSIENMTEGGLGIFLAKKMFDEITYKRKEEKNILTLKKRNQNNFCNSV